MSSKVKQPDHYTAESGLTARRVISDFKLNFNLGSAVKYILREGKKAEAHHIMDLQKAAECINMEIEDRQGIRPKSDWSGLAAYTSAQPQKGLAAFSIDLFDAPDLTWQDPVDRGEAFRSYSVLPVAERMEEVSETARDLIEMLAIEGESDTASKIEKLVNKVIATRAVQS